MGIRPRLHLLLVTTVVLCGCRAAQIQSDQDRFRSALLDMLTNQVMDNLVRAHNGYPIIQLDYTRATGTVSHSAAANLGGGLSVSDDRTIAGAAITVGRYITDSLSYGISGDQYNQLTVTAEPVLNNNEVYDAYLDFLKPDPEFGPRLVATMEPPPSNAAHIVRECGEMYYWVPVGFKYDFLELALATTVQRGRALSIPEFFEATVVSIGPHFDEDGLPDRLFAEITLSTSLHNDSGTLFTRIGGQKHEFRLAPNPNAGRAGAQTNTLLINRNATPQLSDNLRHNIEHLRVAMSGEQVRIMLDSFQPTLPTTRDRIEGLRAELEQIRLQR